MKIVQIGMGGMGNTWLNTVGKSNDVDHAGFVEINDEIAASQAEKHNLDATTIYKSLAAALDNLEVEGVINVTPPQFHRETTNLALERGIPVLTEKPLAGTLEDAQAIVDKASETGVLCMVAQNYRYTTISQTLKSALHNSDVGAIGAVSVEFFKGPHFGGFREEMEHPLIIDMAIHHLDMMRFFLDSDPVTVSAHSWNPIWSWFKGDASASMALTFKDNIAVNYVGSWCSQGRETTWNANWRFDCEKGVVTLENDKVFVYHQQENDIAKEVAPITMERQAQGYLLHEFYEAVTQDSTPATSAQDNIKTVELVFTVVAACASGQTIDMT